MLISPGEDPVLRKGFTRRALLLGGAQACALGLLGSRLFQLQVVEETRYSLLAEENRISVQLIAPQRGRIFDRFGTLLAGNKPNQRAVVVPDLASDLAEVLRRVSRVLPITSAEQEAIVRRARRQGRHVPIVIANDLNWEQLAEISLLAPQLPGVQTDAAGIRQYHHGGAVGHIVGYVGSVERVALDEDPVLRLPGMRIGKVGIELGLEAALRGMRGSVRHEVDARGRVVRILEETPARPGADVVLTIDAELQGRVMARLQREKRAAVVGMDVSSGEVLVMASVPAYDPAEVAAGLSEAAWGEIQSAPGDPLTNRAIRGLYPPGSTYKMVTALAGLEAGVIDLRTRVQCSGRFEFFDSVFRCWKRSGHGSVDLHRALRESCDCYFYEVARRTGVEALAAMARRLGFGQTFECGLPLQKAGVVPDPSWKLGRLNQGWLGGETLLVGIGQGYVLVNPLQLAVMTARLASGRQVEPLLVRAAAGEAVHVAPPLAISEGWLEAVRKGMVAVVHEDGGTGASAQLPIDGVKLAGKTGTAQVIRASSEKSASELAWEERDHSLFVGYAPAGKPRYAVAAIVEHGGGGSLAAGPLVKEVMTDLVKSDPIARQAFSPAVVTGRHG